MDALQSLLSFVLHIDNSLLYLVSTYGVWTYAILFLIIFCETGLILTPFLPGDSLLFASGALTVHNQQGLSLFLLMGILSAGSILGNILNYEIGRALGKHIPFEENSRFFNKKYLNEAHAFYQRHGGKTILLARFLPIIRTFVPFVAGLCVMNRGSFMLFNILSGVLWVASILLLGHWIGSIPFVKQNFSFFVYSVVFLSLLPILVRYLKPDNNKAHCR